MLNFILAVAAIGLLYVVWKNASDDNAILMVLPVIPGSWLLIRLGCDFAVGTIIAVAVSFAVHVWGTNRNKKRPSSSSSTASPRNTDASHAQVDVDELLQEISAMPPSERKELAEALKKSADENGTQPKASTPTPKAPPPRRSPFESLRKDSISGEIALRDYCTHEVYADKRKHYIFDVSQIYGHVTSYLEAKCSNGRVHIGGMSADFELYPSRIVVGGYDHKFGEVTTDETNERILISLSQEFIYKIFKSTLDGLQKDSLLWRRYTITEPEPDKVIAYIDLTSPTKYIQDLETGAVIADFEGDPCGAAAALIYLIAHGHGETWTYHIDRPEEFRYETKVPSKYQDFLRRKIHWCR